MLLRMILDCTYAGDPERARKAPIESCDQLFLWFNTTFRAGRVKDSVALVPYAATGVDTALFISYS